MPQGSAGRARGIAGLAVVAVAGAALAWAVAGFFDEPGLQAHAPGLPHTDPASSRPIAEPATRIVLAEPQVRAMVSEHVPTALGVPVSGVAAGLPGDGVIQAAIKVPARSLVDRAAPAAAHLLPGGWPAHPVWLVLTLKPHLAGEAPGGRRHLELDVEAFRIGSRRLPVAALRGLLSSSRAERLRWPLPRGVEAVTVERGRLVLSGGS